MATGRTSLRIPRFSPSNTRRRGSLLLRWRNRCSSWGVVLGRRRGWSSTGASGSRDARTSDSACRSRKPVRSSGGTSDPASLSSEVRDSQYATSVRFKASSGSEVHVRRNHPLQHSYSRVPSPHPAEFHDPLLADSVCMRRESNLSRSLAGSFTQAVRTPIRGGSKSELSLTSNCVWSFMRRAYDSMDASAVDTRCASDTGGAVSGSHPCASS